jgi:hypothetical protein
VTASIMAYVGSDANVSGISTGSLQTYWANNQLIAIKEGNAATDGLRQFTGYPSGDETLTHTWAQMGLTQGHSSGQGGALCVAYNGQILFISSILSNSVVLGEVRESDLTLTGQFGVSSGSLAQSDTTRILLPYSFAPLRVGTPGAHGDFVVVCANDGTVKGEVDIVSVPNLGNAFIGHTDEPVAVCGRGAINPTNGTAFVLAKKTGTSAAVTPVGLYVVTQQDITPPTLVKLGTVSPAQVDATWTNFTQTGGVAYDQTDGNPIIMVTTNDAVVNQTYFVKLNKANAAVIWKCPVNTFDPEADNDLTRHNIVNQTLYYLGASSLLYTINTSTGVATTATVSLLTCTGGQISEDVNNSLIGFGGWFEGATHPNYIGTYMGTLGNHTLGSGWWRFFPGGPTAPFPAAPVGPPGPAAVSINRAWAYTFDGHWFYVLDLGVEGTFVYDQITKQWAHFLTAGFTPQWDVANGTMWGQRIVGGDLATTTVWEMVPGALKDNDNTLSISHVVTGGVSTRGRDFISCNSLRLIGSLGILDDIAGSAVNLRFSDDNGQTWSPFFTTTLTQGDFGGEVAYRSLGSFDAPGRIFEFSDVGGLVRIDGCDMNAEDEDPKQQG